MAIGSWRAPGSCVYLLLLDPENWARVSLKRTKCCTDHKTSSLAATAADDILTDEDKQADRYGDSVTESDDQSKAAAVFLSMAY